MKIPNEIRYIYIAEFSHKNAFEKIYRVVFNNNYLRWLLHESFLYFYLSLSEYFQYHMRLFS